MGSNVRFGNIRLDDDVITVKRNNPVTMDNTIAGNCSKVIQQNYNMLELKLRLSDHTYMKVFI